MSSIMTKDHVDNFHYLKFCDTLNENLKTLPFPFHIINSTCNGKGWEQFETECKEQFKIEVGVLTNDNTGAEIPVISILEWW